MGRVSLVTASERAEGVLTPHPNIRSSNCTIIRETRKYIYLNIGITDDREYAFNTNIRIKKEEFNRPLNFISYENVGDDNE